MTQDWRITTTSESETRLLAQRIAAGLRAGDVIALRGELGAGKSVFARAIIQAIGGSQTADVPSPTYSLVQTYELERLTVAHFDLFRLEDPRELEELDFNSSDPCLLLIEWPEKAESEIPEDRLDIVLKQTDNENSREIAFTGRGGWAGRLKRFEEIDRFIREAGWVEAQHAYLAGDASVRSYRRLIMGAKRAVLMDAPAIRDEEIVRDGKTYGQIVHRAEDVLPFIAMTQLLRKHGYAAPEILYMDGDAGLLLLEDFGDDRIVKGTPPQVSGERYLAAVNALIALVEENWGDAVDVGGVFTHHIPRFDEQAMLTEAQLVTEWFAPYFAGTPLSAEARTGFDETFLALLKLLEEDTWRLVLRDFHSPNILWRGDRTGVQRLGLIDYQDAVIAHPAYDIVSLLQDARIDMPVTLEQELLNHFLNKTKDMAGFDEDRMRRAYAILGAQRNSKLLGIFARLAKRDGKPDYLKHLPRISRYLLRDLDHAELAPLRDWYETHLPRALSPDQLERLAGRTS